MEKIVIVIAKMVKINILPPTSYCPRIFPDSTDFRFPISDYWYPVKIKFFKKRRFHKESRRILGVLKMTPQFQIKDFELYYF